MLDGILGRGFSGKCKSLMKTTGARIEVVRRRAEAKQRYLNEDLAKLLSNGLDINAYGRTEEFLAGMNLLWCYDFVEQSCEYIVKQLTRMQKQGECPEECREAVASLMYAAARFSDLPELRELRDVFQQRYGNGLEAYVNQKFVEKLSSRPSPKEKRLQVLQDIASGFSIKWDSRGLERTMATPSIVAQVDKQKVDIAKQRPGLLDEKSRVQSSGESNNIWRRDGGDLHISRRKDAIEYKEKSLLKSGGSSSEGGDDAVFYHGRQGFTESKRPYPIAKSDAEMNAERSNISSHGKILDNNARIGYTRHSNGIHNARKGESAEALFQDKTNFAPSSVEHLVNTEKAVSPDNSSKGLDEGSNRLKSCSSYGLPPPYTKLNHKISQPPYIKKPKEDKYKLNGDSQHALPSLDKHLIDPNPCNRSNVANSSGGSCGDPHEHQEQFLGPDKIKSYGHEKELDYQDQKIPLPKPRSIRRKHHKSSSASSHNVVDALEDVGGSVGRSSSSRRKDHSKKGLHMLLDEEHHRKCDEERMIDKLLIHYSKKPSSYDEAKLRKKLTANGESSVHDGNREAIPLPSRSVSLPHEQVESKKVFARSNTFQPDHQARHVHPKLPDYDDLAARFAALKGR